MTGIDIPPEQFSIALGKAMDAVGSFSDIIRSLELGAEFHYMRRVKQIKLGEAPLDHVSLEISIATLRQLEAAVVNTRATLEKVDIKNKQLVGGKAIFDSGFNIEELRCGR